MLEVSFGSRIFYQLFLIIEAGQFAWFTYHPNFDFIWNNSVGDYPRNIVKYFQVNSYFDHHILNTETL